jgi:hypothetical protein
MCVRVSGLVGRKRVRETVKFNLNVPELAGVLGVKPSGYKLVYSIEDVKPAGNGLFTITIRVWDVYEVARGGGYVS